jgi:hypothetical protein
MKIFIVITICILSVVSAFAQTQNRLDKKLSEQNFSDWQAADADKVFYPMISHTWKFNPQIHKASEVSDLESIWRKDKKKVDISMDLQTPEESESSMRMFTIRNISPPSYKIDGLGNEAFLVKFHDRVEIAFIKENVFTRITLSFPSKYKKPLNVYSPQMYDAPKAEVEIALKIARLIAAEIKEKQTVESLTGVKQSPNE